MRLTLFSKPDCHLCEDLRRLLDELQPAYGFVVDEVDISADTDLFARYRYDIPVLMREGRELARGRISEGDLLTMLKTET